MHCTMCPEGELLSTAPYAGWTAAGLKLWTGGLRAAGRMAIALAAEHRDVDQWRYYVVPVEGRLSLEGVACRKGGFHSAAVIQAV